MTKSYKDVTLTGTPESLVSDAVAEFEALAEELGEWRDGMDGTNLEGSDKQNSLGEAVESLESRQSPVTDWPHSEASLTCTVQQQRRKSRGNSRDVRVANSISMVQCVIDFYSGLDDAADHEDLIAELEQLTDDVEIPGMFG